MDPLTHAASGAVAVLACRNRPVHPLIIPLAALAAVFPDVDIFFATTPLNYLLLHRGITHSLFAAPFLGVLLALCFFPYWWRHSPHAWTFGKTALFTTGMILLHIWLDCVTTYGTMIFLPFSAYRVRLSGIFIVDILLILPLLIALWYGLRTRTFAVWGLIWVFLYPAACVGVRVYHQHAIQARLQAEHGQITDLTILPDVFAPLYWRVLYATPDTVWHQGLTFLGQPHAPPRAYPRTEAHLLQSLQQESRSAAVFFDFTFLPIQEYRAPTAGETYNEYCFYDLRFGTALPSIEKIMRYRQYGDVPFQLLARQKTINGIATWTHIRMIFAGASRDSAWHAPDPPRASTGWQWLVGL